MNIKVPYSKNKGFIQENETLFLNLYTVMN